MSLILNELKIANKLVTTSGGSIGIGKSSPTAPLDVNGIALISGSLSISGSANSLIFDAHSSAFLGRYALLPGRFSVGTLSSGYPEIGYNFSPANGVYTKLVGDTAWRIGFGNSNLMLFSYAASGTGTFSWTNAMAIDMSGNVGIGTTAPAYKLHVTDGNNSIAYFGPNASWSSYLAVGAGDNKIANGTAQVISTNGNLHLDSGTAQNTYINYYSQTNTYINVNAGNVGIGTESPTAKLDVNGSLKVKNIKTYAWTSLSANTTQARRYEIARLGHDVANWDLGGIFEIELYSYYYMRSVKKRYAVSYGYPGAGTLSLVEYQGTGDNNFQVTLGTEVVVSGNDKYLPVYIDIRYYAMVDVKVTTNWPITTSSTPAKGYCYISESPSPSNISDFTADSTIEIGSSNGKLYFGGSVGIGTTPTAKLDVNGDTKITGSLLVTGSMTIAGDLIPAEDRKYSLGSSTRRWNDLYVISSSISQITESLMTISNEYTLAVVNGNRVAGFKIAINNQTSSFVIQADKFAVVNDSGNNPISPFIIENNIVYINSASIKNLTADNIAANTITADKIKANTITADRIQANTITANEISASSITTDKLQANSITTDKLQANSITATQISASAITTDKLAANSITTEKLQANSITATQISASAVTADKISASAITTDKLDASAVTAAKIAASAITTDKLDASAVTAGKIAADAVTATQISASAITTAKIAADAIISSHISASAITSTKIAADAVTATQISASAITTAKIAAGAVTADTIASNAITTAKLDASAVTSDKIAANSITATQISASAVTTAKIAADAVTATQISASAITSDKIQAGAITAGKIAANAVTANEISAGSITAVKIAANAVTAEKVEAGAITAGKIAANAVTANEISASAITADKIATSAITADKIEAGAITATKISASAITSDKIAAGAITANMIAAGTISAAVNIQGGQTAYDTGTGWYLSSDGKMSIGNSGGNKLVWDGSKLKVTGGIYITDTVGIRNDGTSTLTITGGPSNASGGQIDLTPGGIVSLVATGGQFIQFVTNNTQRGYVGNDGKFDWLGTGEFDGSVTFQNGLTSNANVVVNGITLTYSTSEISAAAFNSTSSKRYKKNIVEFKSGLSIIEKLRTVTFDWKNKNIKNDIGFIAEEVGTVLPNIVYKNEKGLVESMDYSKLTPILLAAIKELTEEIKELKSRINKLETK